MPLVCFSRWKNRSILSRFRYRQRSMRRWTLPLDWPGISAVVPEGMMASITACPPPHFPPAACCWARTMALSIRCGDTKDRYAKASKRRNQTPFFVHLFTGSGP